MEPHAPYDPPPRFLLRVAPGASPKLADGNTLMRLAFVSRPTAVELRNVTNLYDAAVLEIDERLRALFHGLGNQRLSDETIVVITADHGEGFCEHGLLSHGNSLFEELIH